MIIDLESVSVFLAPAALGGLPGHTLVVPRRHVETIFDLTRDEESDLAHAVADASRAIRRALDPEGLVVRQHNGLAGYQTVPHVHFHVVPTKAGTQFPPAEWIPVIPFEVRAELASVLRSHWP